LIGNNFELKFRSKMYGQNLLNIFYYEQTAGGAFGADLLRAAFNQNILLPLRAVCSDQWKPYDIQVQNLDNGIDFALQMYAGTGNVGADGLPSHDAWSFTYVNIDHFYRSGGKRFGGVSESSQTNGVPTPTALANLVLLEVGLESEIGSGTALYQPRIQNTVPVVGGNIYNGVAAVTFGFLSTQNTRKSNTAPGF